LRSAMRRLPTMPTGSVRWSCDSRSGSGARERSIAPSLCARTSRKSPRALSRRGTGASVLRARPGASSRCAIARRARARAARIVSWSGHPSAASVASSRRAAISRSCFTRGTYGNQLRAYSPARSSRSSGVAGGGRGCG
jgi:hypothetical protein